MDKKKENRKKLWDSLEMAVVRRDLILIGVLWAVMALICWVKFQKPYLQEAGAVMQVVTAVVILPFLGFYLWRAIQIFRSPEEYIFCKCKLASPHQRYWSRGMMYFTVIIEDEELGRFTAQTHAIFASYGIAEPLLETYINQTVTIGYNRETEMVVVIG